jgi:hypothetical protein
VSVSAILYPRWPPLLKIAGHIFGRKPSNDYFIKILFLLSKWFQTRRFLWEFPIGSYVKLSLAVAAIGQNCSILSQKVPKFELYKHNDELFNIPYFTGFFMNFELLPILTDYAN